MGRGLHHLNESEFEAQELLGEHVYSLGGGAAGKGILSVSGLSKLASCDTPWP